MVFDTTKTKSMKHRRRRGKEIDFADKVIPLEKYARFFNLVLRIILLIFHQYEPKSWAQTLTGNRQWDQVLKLVCTCSKKSQLLNFGKKYDEPVVKHRYY